MKNNSVLRTRKSIVESVKKLKFMQTVSDSKSKFSISQKKIIKIDLSPNTLSTSFTPTTPPISNYLTFSTLSRFNNTIYDKFKGKVYSVRPFQLKKLSPKEKQAQTARLNSNRDMTPHSSSLRYSKLTEKKNKQKIAQTLTALTKQELYKQKNETFKSVLNDKFRGFLIRNNKTVRHLLRNA
jgi:hypothetical protein